MKTTNPEPLTKEIEKKIKKELWDKKYPEAYNDWEELNSTFRLTEIITETIKERVDLVLKEIEKTIPDMKYIQKENETWEQTAYRWFDELDKFQNRVRQKIKKVFEGVIE